MAFGELAALTCRSKHFIADLIVLAWATPASAAPGRFSYALDSLYLDAVLIGELRPDDETVIVHSVQALPVPEFGLNASADAWPSERDASTPARP